MAWIAHQLRFRARSQLHVGFRKVGNIQMTRRYIPARTLWGALTARLTRGAQYGEWRLPGDIPPGDYAATGERVRREIVFSYFFPEDEAHRPLPPRREPDGLKFGDVRMTRDTFEWRFLGSYSSTALDYGRGAVDEGTLHEVEFIAPNTREDVLANGEIVRSHPVFWTGYVLAREDTSLPWGSALKEIQVGGERGYGWGQLRLGELKAVPVTGGETFLFERTSCRLDGDRPVVSIPGGSYLLSHAKATGFEASGEVEPFVSRSWDFKRGAGQQVEMTGGVCHAPGSRVADGRDHLFTWEPDNTWRHVGFG
jgi:hypothetical protein